ncbi:Putative uncharacterized protein TTHA1760 [hydrothermal vent metagenome]|uniref:Quinol:cytochrome C oxidoreductase n=1 Tax=hydrothermal vent metagenome TaxID=652676 RepID=A0A3B0UJ23_9ZZZZ
MDKKLYVSKSFKNIMIVMIVIGLAAVATGFLTGATTRTWANLLLENFFFLSVTLGALFWMAIQAVTNSGWSAAFVRVPQAVVSYLMVAAILWIVLFFGIPILYHWAQPGAALHDAALAHKAFYLNVPFFIARIVVFFVLWIFLVRRIKKLSLNEDQIGGIVSFNKIELLSKVFIFVLAISFVFVGIDWLMSLDAHWFSTLFAVKFFISAFYHGSAVIVGAVIILNKLGYFPFLNKSHLHNFSKYIFMLSIMWAYMWFVQYLMIWYGNLPEETIYWHMRRTEGFQGLFLAEIFINWLFPFLFLMWNRMAKNANALLITVGVLVVGEWIELYNAIIPETVHKVVFGYLEIGLFVGFAGLFLLIGALSLSKHPLVAKNHPYLHESIAAEEE